VDAFLVPTPETRGIPRVPAFDWYDAPEAENPFDGPEDAIVVPEAFPGLLAGAGRATVVCWWLSVDNSPLFAATQAWRRRRIWTSTEPLARLVARRIKGRILRLRYARLLRAARHVCQSHYAQATVSAELGVPAQLLTDYVVVQGMAPRPGRVERVRIAYNPAKGGDIVEAVQDAMSDDRADWLPISGMSQQQVCAALASADVYLDLGHQPGKDRMPREAAMAGAVTLVARFGAGASDKDFPLPDQHRIPTEPEFLANVRRTLELVMEDVPHHWELQASFRDALAREREVFRQEVVEIFKTGGHGSGH
jgi:hypothetical protein